MIGHVTYGDTESVIVQGDEVVKVSSNCGHGNDAGTEVKSRALWKFLGENAQLDIPCYFQFLLELFLLNNLGLGCFQVIICLLQFDVLLAKIENREMLGFLQAPADRADHFVGKSWLAMQQ